jgi:hypothetical protein
LPVEGLRKSKANFIQSTQSPGRDENPELAENKSAQLPFGPIWLVSFETNECAIHNYRYVIQRHAVISGIAITAIRSVPLTILAILLR